MSQASVLLSSFTHSANGVAAADVVGETTAVKSRPVEEGKLGVQSQYRNCSA